MPRERNPSLRHPKRCEALPKNWKDRGSGIYRGYGITTGWFARHPPDAGIAVNPRSFHAAFSGRPELSTRGAPLAPCERNLERAIGIEPTTFSLGS